MFSNFKKIISNPWLAIFLISTLGISKNVMAQARVYGNMMLETDYVEKGLTQSDHKPAFEAAVGYLFSSQGKVGFQAASVNFAGESVNLEMRLLGEYKFIFNSSFDLKVREDVYNYSPSSQRNNMVMTLDFGSYGYHTLVASENNFEGTKTQRTWIGFHKDWFMAGGIVGGTVGYSSLNSSSGYSSYFDTRASYTYNFTNAALSLYNTYNSKASQFDGKGDLAFFAAFEIKF